MFDGFVTFEKKRMYVKPKKHLGQHFLTDKSIAEKIVVSLQCKDAKTVLEIGPGTGVLTEFLLKRQEITCFVAEIDRESVEFLNQHFPELRERVLPVDFLRFHFDDFFKDQTSIIGNFPYNISSQILFRVLENKQLIPEVVGMFQKEVAERIASPPGSKVYGILSVLIQAYYTVDYLFTVHENVFNPPPKVKSAVIRLVRREKQTLNCDEKLFFNVVKTSFNQRRKTLNNSMKPILGNRKIEHDIMLRRPETLSVEDFVFLTAESEKILKTN
jgi:16S rRNA (adenine1518-N6/adenine1519-N6)-dimethyltransferase